MGLNGRVVIPAEVRHSLHLNEGDTLLLSVDEQAGRLVLETEEAVIQRLRALVGTAPSGERGSDALLRERREEAAREAREMES
jgi:AbrB family looped-hinge helix DNA binding protein